MMTDFLYNDICRRQKAIEKVEKEFPNTKFQYLINLEYLSAIYFELHNLTVIIKRDEIVFDFDRANGLEFIDMKKLKKIQKILREA